MHPMLMSAFAGERSAELRATAALRRRGRIARLRKARPVKRPRARLAHA